MQKPSRCPRCSSPIQSNRVIGGTVVCQCGWSQSIRSEWAEQRNVLKNSIGIVFFGGLLIWGFIHSVHWDHHFFTIIPLKAKQFMGSAEIKDYEKMAQICLERRKTACVEEAYYALVKKDPNNINYLNRLGHFLGQQKKWQQASDVFSSYFRLKGEDADAAYVFALSSTKLKKYDLANQYFLFALNRKQHVVPVTIVRSYVQMLMEAKKFQQAKSVIIEYRQKITNASLFMNKELDEIQSRLGERKTATSTEG
ncbi:MAG: hypothetical protein K1X29_11030 [Bdellovibrionales bacterium]|nr:hypothetical protein [Bdellovibrionales bacterium]